MKKGADDENGVDRGGRHVGLRCGQSDAAGPSEYLGFIRTDMPRLMRTEGSRGPCSSAACMIGKGSRSATKQGTMQSNLNPGRIMTVPVAAGFHSVPV
jgi:hypothetical protein